MEILFKTPRLQEEFNDSKKLQKKRGSLAQVIMMRMSQLRAAENLEQLRHAPGKFHGLMGDRQGQIACSLGSHYRLIFEPADDLIPTLSDGKGLDWSRITKVGILEIEDYH